MNIRNPPRRSSKNNNNTDMASYTAMLTKDTTPYDKNKILPTKLSHNIMISISYHINVTNNFPSITTNYQHQKRDKKNLKKK